MNHMFVEGMDDDGSRYLQKLFQQYYKLLLNYVMARLTHKNIMVAEDIVQSVFLEAWRKRSTLKDHPNPVGWLIKTGDYKMRAWKRLGSTSEVSLDERPIESGATDYRLSAVEILIAVEAILNEREQELFRSYFIEGYSIREMAERERITETAFKMRVFRMREKIRNYLEKDR